MKKVSIILPDGQTGLSTVACIAGAADIFAVANRYEEAQGRRALFRVQTVGASLGNVSVAGFSMTPDAAAPDVRKTDLIIIPSSLVRSYDAASAGNRLLIDWIGRQQRGGAEVASLCSGLFMLAATGALRDRTCSTHWAVSAAFRELHPGVALAPDRLITDEDGIYTNGGAYSFLHLLLYLVEKYFGRQTAIHCSKIFQVDLDRKLQSAFAIFSGHKKHADGVVLEAQDYLELHYAEKITIDGLSARYNVGRRSFDRRFVRATGMTPLDYLQRVRIESAKKSLEDTRKTVGEVMYEAGYSDSKAFREVFSRVTGVTPLDYKAKYNRGVV